MSRVYRSGAQAMGPWNASQVVAAAAGCSPHWGCPPGPRSRKSRRRPAFSAPNRPTHGPKAALLKAAAEYVTLGASDKASVFDLELGRSLMAAGDRDEAFRSMISVLSDMYERGASLWLTLAGAATQEPELRRFCAEWVADVTLKVGDYSGCAATVDGYAKTFRSTTLCRRQQS